MYYLTGKVSSKTFGIFQHYSVRSVGGRNGVDFGSLALAYDTCNYCIASSLLQFHTVRTVGDNRVGFGSLALCPSAGGLKKKKKTQSTDGAGLFFTLNLERLQTYESNTTCAVRTVDGRRTE